jgi:gamma-glutamyltranspeptidase/glutathione hydrolase
MKMNPRLIHGRGPVIAPRGMVAADHPLAVSAGIQALREGGSAMDAALACAAVLTVVQPHWSHLGGDLFLLAYDADTGSVRAVNSSGIAPRGATRERYDAGGCRPRRGPLSCAGPGVPAGWWLAHQRWGRLPWRRLFDAAIGYAADGFPISTRLALILEMNVDVLRQHEASARQFMPDGDPPRPGRALRQPHLAATLRAIAEGGADAFYRGEIARRMADAFKEAGGLIAEEDLASTEAEELDPLQTTYRGYTVFEQPPVSQGFIVLEVLNMIERFDMRDGDAALRVHLMAEAEKLAYEDRFRHLGDPRHVDVPIARLVSKEHAAERAALIDPDHARAFRPPGQFPTGGDTTYLCAVDPDGNAVSLIQSVFAGFGSGFVAGDTGVLFNNRLSGFTLELGHPNELVPGKRTVHTLNTWLALRDGRVAMVGGTPGADRQVMTNVQMLNNVIDLGMDAQAALDQPRWSIAEGTVIHLEEGFPPAVVAGLERRGHTVTSLGAWAVPAGRASLIVVDPESGARMGAQDLRGEGQAQGF